MFATKCSHVLMWVRDIHQAVHDYRQLGFTVDYATAPEKAQHAHIWFPQGPIIELLTTPRGARFFKWPIDLMAGRGAGRRMVRWSADGEGFCDVAVVMDTPDLAGELSLLRRQDIAMGRAVRWTRVRPDGQRIRFQFAYPRRDRLPFVVTPYQPAQHAAGHRHANGATGVSRVHVEVRADDIDAFRLIAGADPTFVMLPSETTRVRCVELNGLQEALDPSLLHGAEIRLARA